MAFTVLAGDRYNAAAYGTVTSSSTDSTYPLSRLTDGFFDEFWYQAAIGADGYLSVDLNQITNGTFETYSGGAFTGWTSETNGGGSTVTQDSGTVKAGTYSCKLTVGASGGSYARVYQNLTVRTGAPWRGSFSFYAGAAGAVKLEIYNPYTRNYLATGGTWQSSQTYFKTTAGTGSWEDFTVSFSVESWAACQSSTTTLRFRVESNTSSTVGYVDQFYQWPETNFAAFFAHNCEAGLPVQWRSSTDGFASSDVLVATLTARAGVLFSYQSSSVTTRYVRLKFSGTPVAKLRATELVFGYAAAPADAPVWGYVVDRTIPQIRSSRGSVRMADFSTNAVVLDFEPSSTQWDELEQEIYERASGGQTIILVPDTGVSRVFVGRIPERWRFQAVWATKYKFQLPLEPLALGTWLP